MTKRQTRVWLAVLLALMIAGVPLHAQRAAAQDTPSCEDLYAQADALFQQAQAALGEGNVLSALYLIQEGENLITPCIPEDTATGLFVAGSENRWTPVEREIDGVPMVQVPAGCFLMGSEEGASDEQPVHEICFAFPYWIDKTEVTRGMYAQCVATGACTGVPDNEVSTRDSQPVTRVTWTQAQAYCTWRGLQLPTEAEWEYAARGPAGWLYPWGSMFENDKAVYGLNADDVTADVGSRPDGASWVGAVDMSGNVAEWVRSVYRPYPFTHTSGDENALRVVRGGSFYYALSSYLTATHRDHYTPSFERDSIGFRCGRPNAMQPAPEDSCDVRIQKAQALLENQQGALEMGYVSYTLLLLNDTRAMLEPCIDNTRWQPVVRSFDGVNMVQVPAGCFMMGQEGGVADLQPTHEICFSAPFWIDETEVTRAMYAQCVEAGACDPPPPSEFSVRVTQPVNRVTWLQARDYCAWREARLPTEAEWEYAARGPNSLLYPWGESFGARQAVYNNRDKGTEDVGSRPGGASWVGALDMSGNLGEWVSSIYSGYPYNAGDGRENPDDLSSPRVWRGGSFFDFDDEMLTAAVRKRANPTYENHSNGFRCTRSN